MNKIIILENNGGRLANQLWQYAIVYAFCLENNYYLENYNFFAYQKFFNIKEPENKFVRFLFFRFYKIHKNIKLNKLLYLIFSNIIKVFHYGKIISPKEKIILSPGYIDNVKGKNEILYFCGWNFRNPTGLIKYHSDIVKFFRPKEELIIAVELTINQLKNKYKKIVGVHVRHGDYKKFSGGKYYFEFEDVRNILDSFLKKQQEKSVIFFICSDDEIPDKVFNGLEYVKGFGDPIKDLHALSLTGLIISSESTFSQWAAYYGNINNINFSRKEINWDHAFILNNDNNPWLVGNN